MHAAAKAPAALQRRLDYAGPALFSYGFRPFFLGAAVWAALSIALWLPQYFGHFDAADGIRAARLAHS
jgi:uncharacterized protein involved in response to NO